LGKGEEEKEKEEVKERLVSLPLFFIKIMVKR
jgi:hypothetical protein